MTDLKSQDSMNVGSYTLVPTYSKGYPVEITMTAGSDSENSARSPSPAKQSLKPNLEPGKKP